MEDGVLPAGSAAIRQVVTIECNDNVTVPVKELRVGISPLFPLPSLDSVRFLQRRVEPPELRPFGQIFRGFWARRKEKEK